MSSFEDAQECENDTYLRAWNTIPPQLPNALGAFLAKITRNLSLDQYDKNNAAKRGKNETDLLFEELEECIPDSFSVEATAESDLLKKLLDSYLATLHNDTRVIFMRRYWFGNTVDEIAELLGCKTSKVKMSLKRSRDELRQILEKEGYSE